MRDIQTEQVLCLACHNPVPQKHGKRARLYCNDVCKTTYHRKLAREAIHAALLDGYLPETQQVLGAVQGHSMELAQQVARAINGEVTYHLGELEEENRKLREQLDVEARYLRDEEYRAFKTWLIKYRPTGGYPRGSFQQRVLDDARFTEPRYRRTDYLYRLEIWGYSAADRARFADLWKAMLLQP